ncbi:MAG: TonB-dependent receptor [Bacteroidales bacterium]|jgi:outer membrane receptor protein involved in Fe transport|nr:TonB-dependent receptor [Bacteroidales bacterium]
MKQALFFLFLTLLISSHPVFAQPAPHSISGNVLDKDGTPIEFASVVLQRNGGTPFGTMTGPDGRFNLKNIPEGTYSLRISFIGYREFRQEISVPAETGSGGIEIILDEDHITLSETVITATKQAKRAAAEKTVINTGQSIASATGSVLDVIKLSPAVRIDSDNIVSVRGNANVLLLIDGVPTTVESLASFPVSSARNIEIITSPGVQYDSEGTGGIINIVTRSGHSGGLSGLFAINWDLSTELNGTLAMNYSGKLWTINGQYSLAHEEDEVTSTLFRQFAVSSNSVSQALTSTPKHTNHALGIDASCKLSGTGELFVSAKGIVPENLNSQIIKSTTITDGISESFRRRNEITFNRKTIEGSIRYKQTILPEKQTLTASANISQTKGNRPAFYYETPEGSTTENMVQRSEGGGAPFAVSGQLDYRLVLRQDQALEAGLKFSHRSNNFKYDSWILENETWKHSDYFSSDLKHSEIIPAAYINYNQRISEKYSFEFGGRIEYSLSRLNSIKEQLTDYTTSKLFFAPFLSFTFIPGKEQSLDFAFSRRITRPAYPQLNPYVNRIDRNVYETGNKYLKPETTNKTDLVYSLNTNHLNLVTAAYFNWSSDYICQVSSLYDKDALILTYINAQQEYKTGLEINFRANVFKWAELGIGSNIFYSKYLVKYQGMDLTNQGWMQTGNASLHFYPLKGSSVEITYYYNTRQIYPQFTADPVHYMDIGIRQVLFNGKCTATLLFSDVFNTHDWNLRSENNVYTLTNFSKGITRLIWVGFTWRFNAYKGSSKKESSRDEDRSLIRLGN